MIEVNGHFFKSKPQEMTLGEFERVSYELNRQDVDNLQRYINVFNILGLPLYVIDELEFDDFCKIIGKWRKEANASINSDKLIPEVIIDGVSYKAHDGKMKWLIPDLRLIEKVSSSQDAASSMIIAVLFKKEGLTNTEHRDFNHIKFKSKLFRDKFPVDVAIPYLVETTRVLADGIKKSFSSEEKKYTETTEQLF